MKKRFEILVEEHSMEVFLKNLLPRILPDSFTIGINCFIYPHEGKQDLQKRLPKRIKAYRSYPQKVILLVIQDQDSSDCKVLKRKLLRLIREANGNTKYLIRIACKELENWYLGDLNTVQKIFPTFRAGKLKNKAKFRDVDRLNGAEEMKNLSKEFTKVQSARAFGQKIEIENNKSVSFNHFVDGILSLLQEEI